MHVLDITIVSMRFSDDASMILGDVQLELGQSRTATTGTQTITLRCQSTPSRRVRPDSLLVGDALRQLRRMPVVRSGEARLTFAKGLKPLGAERRVA